MKQSKQYAGTINRVRAILGIESPIIVLDIVGQEQGIPRTPKQFLLDLQDSHLIPSNIKDINNPMVQDAMIDLKGGTVSGNVEFFKAGSKYKAHENSSVITNPEHPLYGKVKLGQEVEREKDGSRVEGFLSLDRSFVAKQTRANASALSAQMMEALGGATPQATTNHAEVVAEEVELPEEPAGKGK